MVRNQPYVESIEVFKIVLKNVLVSLPVNAHTRSFLHSNHSNKFHNPDLAPDLAPDPDQFYPEP